MGFAVCFIYLRGICSGKKGWRGRQPWTKMVDEEANHLQKKFFLISQSASLTAIKNMVNISEIN